MSVTEATEQLSAVVGVPKVTEVATQFASAFTVTAAGAVMVGRVVSDTVTVCVAVAVFPEASVTVHVTVVFPNWNVPGALFVATSPEQLSEVVAEPKLTPVATQLASAYTVSAAGAVMVGGVDSRTDTVNVAVVTLFEPSVAV